MLLHTLSEVIGSAFQAHNIDQSYGRVQAADRPDLADFQCNGALQAAKKIGQKPRELAEKIVANLLNTEKNHDIFEKIEIAGPGFINLTIKAKFLQPQLQKQSSDNKLGYIIPRKKKILLEYCSPNVAKDMHVGHLRNTVIGDAVKRLLKFCEHDVITDNHLGDWGLQLGQVFSEMERLYPELPYFDTDYSGNYPEKPPLSFEDLCKIYPIASQKSKQDEQELKRAQLFTARLHQGDRGLRMLWQHIVSISVDDMKRKLLDFGVEPMDIWYGESYFEQYIPRMMQDLKEKNISCQVDDAIGIQVALPDDKFEIPPLILEKTMGGVTYATTDLATFYQRQKDFDPDICIILTDYRQELHFERVYRAAKRAGYAERMTFIHLMYGTIDGSDGKPFKTRSGGTPSFDYLMTLIFEKAEARLKEIGLDKKLSPDQFNDTARSIGLAAMKFGDLINYRRSNYIFDLDKFVSFEGKTGPYIQYTVVRINSLLAKASQQNIQSGELNIDPTQKEIGLLLLEFPHAIEGALDDYAPNILCDYLFRLAQSINRFYQTTPILNEENTEKRGSNVALMAQCAKILTKGLELLGITIPQQM